MRYPPDQSRDAARIIMLAAFGALLPFVLLGFGGMLGISIWEFKEGEIWVGLGSLLFSLFFLLFGGVVVIAVIQGLRD